METIDHKGPSGKPPSDSTQTEASPTSSGRRSLRLRLTLPVELIREGDDVMARVGELTGQRGEEAKPDEEGEEEPPRSCTGLLSVELPPPLSAIALRVTDGAFLVSLEDADDRDLTGRTIQRFMVLNEEERAELLRAAQEAADDCAANILGGLPKRKA